MYMGILLIFVSKSIKESNTQDVGDVESSVIVGGDVHAGYSPNNRARGFPLKWEQRKPFLATAISLCGYCARLVV